jgi:hypothetical protein
MHSPTAWSLTGLSAGSLCGRHGRLPRWLLGGLLCGLYGRLDAGLRGGRVVEVDLDVPMTEGQAVVVAALHVVHLLHVRHIAEVATVAGAACAAYHALELFRRIHMR